MLANQSISRAQQGIISENDFDFDSKKAKLVEKWENPELYKPQIASRATN